MFALADKRKEITADVAQELGLIDPARPGAADQAMVEQQTTETIEGCGMDTNEPADCSDADRTTRRLLSEHRALTDEAEDDRRLM